MKKSKKQIKRPVNSHNKPNKNKLLDDQMRSEQNSPKVNSVNQKNRQRLSW